MNHHSQEEKTTSMAIIAIVAALGVVVMATIFTIPLQQQAEAQRGVCGTPGFFPSAIHSGNRSLISCLPR
jgi:hypothetical protein